MATRLILRNGTRRSKANNTHRLTARCNDTPRLYILPNFSPEWPVFLVGIERNVHTPAGMLAKAAVVRVKQKCLPGNF
jgi:hypothetical protein